MGHLKHKDAGAPFSHPPGLSRVLSRNPLDLGLSLAWAAPEVLLGHRSPSTSVDVFGVGWLVYATMAGRLPYGGLAGRDLVDAMREVLQGRGVPPLPLPDWAPWQEESSRLSAACLAFNPRSRPDIGEAGVRACHLGQGAGASGERAPLSAMTFETVFSFLTISGTNSS